VFRSVGVLLSGIIRRWFLWAPALLLDPFDLYDKYLKSKLPKQYQYDYDGFMTEYGLYIIIALIALAAFFTFQEVRQRADSITDLKKIRTNLVRLYQSGENLQQAISDGNKSTPDLETELQEWSQTTADYIAENVADSRAQAFAHVGPSTGFYRGLGDRSPLMHTLNGRLENLSKVMEKV